jgi:hypothetical protein
MFLVREVIATDGLAREEGALLKRLLDMLVKFCEVVLREGE